MTQTPDLTITLNPTKGHRFNQWQNILRCCQGQHFLHKETPTNNTTDQFFSGQKPVRSMPD